MSDELPTEPVNMWQYILVISIPLIEAYRWHIVFSILVNTGLGKSLLHDGSKPSSEPVLHYSHLDHQGHILKKFYFNIFEQM